MRSGACVSGARATYSRNGEANESPPSANAGRWAPGAGRGPPDAGSREPGPGQGLWSRPPDGPPCRDQEGPIDHQRLSRTLAHALRHEPWVYELAVDEEGWASLPRLLEALRSRQRWEGLDREDVREMQRRTEKRRYEIHGDRIRALYGHSLPGRLSKEEARPPDRLWHGTSPGPADSILEEGLRPMGRQFVHLSADRPTAREVGRRKAEEPVILAVRARRAHEGGVAFYRGNEKVWLADRVAARWLERS